MAAVAVTKVVGEAELLGAFLETGLEVGVERHLEVGHADAEFLVGRRRVGLSFICCTGAQASLSASAAGANAGRMAEEMRPKIIVLLNSEPGAVVARPSISLLAGADSSRIFPLGRRPAGTLASPP